MLKESCDLERRLQQISCSKKVLWVPWKKVPKKFQKSSMGAKKVPWVPCFDCHSLVIKLCIPAAVCIAQI